MCISIKTWIGALGVVITNMGITYFERDNQLIEKRKARALERIADALEKMLGEETPAE